MMNGKAPLIQLICILLFTVVLSSFAHGYYSYISWENQIGLSLGAGLSSGVELTEADVSPVFEYKDRLTLQESFTLGWYLYSEDDYASYLSSWSYYKDQMAIKSITLELRREKEDYQIYSESRIDDEVLTRINEGMIWLNRPDYWRLFYGSELTYADLTHPSFRFIGTKYEEGEDKSLRYQLIRGKVSDSEYVYGGKIIYQSLVKKEGEQGTGLGLSFLTFENANYIPIDQIFTLSGIFNPNEYLTITSEFVRTIGGDNIDFSYYQEWNSRSYFSSFHKVSLLTEFHKADYGYTEGDADLLGYSAFVKYRTFDIFHYVINWISGYENEESALTTDNPLRVQAYSLTTAWNIFNMPSIHMGTKYTESKDKIKTVDADKTDVYAGTGIELWEDTYFSTQWLLSNLSDTGSAATANRNSTELISNGFTTTVLWGVLDINHTNQADLIAGGHINNSIIEYNNVQSFGDADFQTQLYFIANRDDRETLENSTLGLQISWNKRFE
ncbi:MAG: hypothetical protein ABIH39_02950, partial [Candidatus Margulisiibacteriota bacterium]